MHPTVRKTFTSRIISTQKRTPQQALHKLPVVTFRRNIGIQHRPSVFQHHCCSGNDLKLCSDSLHASITISGFSTQRISCFSTNANSATENEEDTTVTATSTRRKTHPRNLAKPFLLQCHPDVHKSEIAKAVNLQAIQNLNSYLDKAQNIIDRNRPISNENNSTIIDFIIRLPDQARGKKKQQQQQPTSRRKVELTFPSSLMYASKEHVLRHTAKEMIKLLRVAGIDLPEGVSEELLMEHNPEERWNDPGEGNTLLTPRERYEQSKRRFLSRIDWKKIDQLYEEAVRDMEADLQTEGLVRRSKKLRRGIIRNILSNLRLKSDTIPDIYQFIAFRRLSLLFEDNFERLHLDEAGAMWEKTFLVLTPERSNGGQMSKRKRNQSGEPGFSFALHPNNAVTMEIPIDFTDEELLQELDRNLWDFYSVIDEDLDDLLFNGISL